MPDEDLKWELMLKEAEYRICQIKFGEAIVDHVVKHRLMRRGSRVLSRYTRGWQPAALEPHVAL